MEGPRCRKAAPADAGGDSGPWAGRPASLGQRPGTCPLSFSFFFFLRKRFCKLEWFSVGGHVVVMSCETAFQVIDLGRKGKAAPSGDTQPVGGSAACPALALAPAQRQLCRLRPREVGALGEVSQVAWASEKLRGGAVAHGEIVFPQTSCICHFPDTL